jgi:ubiquinone/menaquinone biosynthesis C-methylase UbiE
MEIAIEMAPKVSFEKMDMRSMTFADSSFDGIWASASILHLPKNEALLVIKDIKRILKNNGVFYLGLKQGEGEEFKVNKGEGNLEGARRYFTYYSKNEVEKILSNLNLQLVEYVEEDNRGNIWMGFFSINNK